jgi:RimJ/RimL family protein N-acetyltransferase
VWVSLTTERLILRRLTEADIDQLVELDSDPEVLRYINGGTPTPREVIRDEILPRFLAYYERDDGFGYWATVERSTGEFLGWFTLRPEEEGDPGVASLGYRLRQSAWGKGYGSEGARALIRKGFTELGVQRVVATTYEHNVASRRVMEKAGMKLVRTYRMTLEQLAATGTFVPTPDVLWEGDDVDYAIEKADWERLETALLTE